MRICIPHSRNFDFKKELYKPILESSLNKNHIIIFPHEKTEEPFNSKNEIMGNKLDLIIAEISHPSTSLGVEIDGQTVKKFR